MLATGALALTLLLPSSALAGSNGATSSSDPPDRSSPASQADGISTAPGGVRAGQDVSQPDRDKGKDKDRGKGKDKGKDRDRGSNGKSGYRFPVVGPWSLVGGGGLFGAPRPGGRKHAGQDIAAPVGTPLVAPYKGVIKVVTYQASGAGYYIVMRGDDRRDYVFMHLQRGSIVVSVGQRVRSGQRIANTGNTGHSTGPHLHFEIWVGGNGWYAGGKPVDPLPYLKRWAKKR